jgi:hypothetical protein
MKGYERKPEKLRSLWRPRFVFEDTIEMELKIVGRECLN